VANTGSFRRFQEAAEKKKKKVVRLEQILQQSAVIMCQMILQPPPQGPLIHFINNGMGRSAVEGSIAKSMGMLAGMPDWLVLWRSIAFFIEWKKPGRAGRSDELNPAQKKIQPIIRQLGFPVFTIDSLVKMTEVFAEFDIPMRDFEIRQGLLILKPDPRYQGVGVKGLPIYDALMAEKMSEKLR